MGTIYIISEKEPERKSTGKIWIKPSECQAFIFLNDQWRPFAGGDNYIQYSIPLTFLINGVDFTRNVLLNSVTKVENINQIVDTLDFSIEEIYENLDINEGEEIIVFKKENVSDIPEVFFAGIITNVKKNQMVSGIFKYNYSIQCSDYSEKLNKALVVEVYENKDMNFIIKDILENYANELDYEEIQDPPVINKISFNYKRPIDCIQQIVEEYNYFWRVNENKTIYIYRQGTEFVSYKITEDNDTSNYSNLVIDFDRKKVRNRVYVRGGIFLSDIFSEEQYGDGIKQCFKLAHKPHNPVKVYVDTGSGYEQKTLAVDTPSASNADFVVNYSEGVIKNLDHSTLASNHKIKITYKYEIQVLTQDDDENSQAFIRQIEGGDGVYSYLITDTSICSIDDAHNVAKKELEKNAYPVLRGNFFTRDTGYKTGKTVVIDKPSLNLSNQEFLIQKVVSTIDDDNKFSYEIEFSGRYGTLISYFIELEMKLSQMAMKDLTNETIHYLKNLVSENFSISDNTINSYERNLITNPYKWGSNSDEGKWNEFQWQ